ncbi:MAG: hypothetical protein AB7K52_06995 [Phycisphaerales bacterium]
MAIQPVQSSGLSSLFAAPPASAGGLAGLFGPAGASKGPSAFVLAASETPADRPSAFFSSPGLSGLFEDSGESLTGASLSDLFGSLQAQSIGARLQVLGLGDFAIAPGSGTVADLFGSPAAPTGSTVTPGDFLLGPRDPKSSAAGSILDAFFRPQFELLGDVIDTFG